MKRKQPKGKARATFKLFGGPQQNPVGAATFFGKSYKKALASGKRFLRNVAAGFWDDTGFHPLRSSYDYKPARVGEKRAYKPRKHVTTGMRRGLGSGKRKRR